jgi:hypothetical protein
MDKSKMIKCSRCEYAQQDKNASEYSVKHCRKCEKWEDCEICRGCKKADTCKVRTSQSKNQRCERRGENICSQQFCKWAAIQCVNPDSEYHGALLNVSPSGDKQSRVTWSGCCEGVAL